ncbi:Branched-chain amino acid transport system permease protein [Bradyrhizobiaceae bacterium SG-6C]|nr:Branched-chain amino acid transport system permease protein [Bradyrhizobiaceae bacterium SG-6C]
MIMDTELPEVVDRDMYKARLVRMSGILLTAAGLLAFPRMASTYGMTLAVEVLIAGVFASGINLLVGYTGMVSLGQAMFLGFGGYGIAMGTALLGWPLWVSVPVTLVVSGLMAVLIGAICTRTRGVEFLLITLAFSQMFYGAAVKLRWTNGSDGMTGIPRPDLSLLGLSADDPAVFYYYVLGIAAIVLILVWRIVNSPFGSVLIGIRENESRVTAMGYSVPSYKIGSFAVAGMICASAGILQSQYTYFINPDSMSWQMSGEGILMAIIGGLNVVVGPFIGAAVFVLVKSMLSQVTEEYNLFFGVFFMLVVAFFRGGIGGALRTLWERRR